MRLGARILCTLTISLFSVPSLFADGVATSTVNDEESAASFATPTTVVNAESALAPERSSTDGYRLPDLDAPPAGATHASSQSDHYPPRAELFFGYSFWRAMPTSANNRIGYLHGGSTSLAININKYFGIAADFGGYSDSRVTLFTPTSGRTVDSSGAAYDFLIGPRLSFRNHERFTPFVQALFGAVHASDVTISQCAGSPACTPLVAEDAFAAVFGAGLDLNLNRHIALRLFQGEFLLTHFKDPFSIGGQVPGYQKNVRFSSGIVFRFGGKPTAPPMNHPPTATCSVDKSMVFLGSNDTVAVSAIAADPDNDALAYTWTATGGKIEGNGGQVRWLSDGTTEGSYTVSVKVDDGRGGGASCSSDIRVEPKPNHPPTITCSANPSSVFAGERSTITCNASDPDGDRLNYTWRANGGKITGSGASGDFDTTGLAPGNYSITTRVEDGHGGAADASVTVAVKPVPPPPQASKINECAFGKPLSSRIDNVCKRILDDVALRMQSEPRATVVIIGYSDPKERQANKVAGDRGTNAVKYLGEKGIEASRATTRTGSGMAGANNNRRIDVIWVPEGATY